MAKTKDICALDKAAMDIVRIIEDYWDEEGLSDEQREENWAKVEAITDDMVRRHSIC